MIIHNPTNKLKVTVKLANTLAVLTPNAVVKSDIVEEYNTSEEKIYSTKYANQTFAPFGFAQPIYFTKVDALNATAHYTKPSIDVNNYMTTVDTTNTVINWDGTQKLTIILTSAMNFIVSNGNSVELDIDTAFNRNTECEYGARLFLNETKIASEQTFGLHSYTGNTSFTDVYHVTGTLYVDQLNNPIDVLVGDILTLEIFKRQSTTVKQTTRYFCGVNVNGEDRYSLTQFNSGVSQIGTLRLADGSVTYKKLDDNVKAMIGYGALIGNIADVYVSKSSGSDDTGDGTENSPYATIQKAIDSIPCLYNSIITYDTSYMTKIHINADTYDGFNAFGKNFELYADGVTYINSDIYLVNCTFASKGTFTLGGRTIYFQNAYINFFECNVDIALCNFNSVEIYSRNSIINLAHITSNNSNSFLYLSGGICSAEEVIGTGNVTGFEIVSGILTLGSNITIECSNEVYVTSFAGKVIV